MKKSFFRPFFAAFLAISLIFAVGCSGDDDSGEDTPTDSSEKITEADGTTTIKIQENGSGFVSTTGEVKTEFGGYSGSGYIDGVSDGGNIVYTITAEAVISDAKIALHYLCSEPSRKRGAIVSVNGVELNAENPFALTSDNKVKKDNSSESDWKTTEYLTGVPLVAGSNSIIVTGAPDGDYTAVGGGEYIDKRAV